MQKYPFPLLNTPSNFILMGKNSRIKNNDEINRFQYYFTESYMEKTPNPSIHCTVKSCANHNKTSDYCVLDKINVGTHECNPTVSQCVDCESFVLSADCSKGGCKAK